MDSTKKATFDASISDQVTNTVESNWSETDSIDVKQTIKYGLSFLGSGGGGETSISYSHSWGEGGSESKEVTVGSVSGVSVELNPNESIEAVLTANRGVMKVRLVYHAELSGVFSEVKTDNLPSNNQINLTFINIRVKRKKLSIVPET